MKQIPYLKGICFLLYFFIPVIIFAQTGYVSGTIKDNDGAPLPGVNVIIKGKSIGVQTDFDGNYRIKCAVGDVLLISYIGTQSREIKVTTALFGQNQIASVVRKIPVALLLDSTYQTAVREKIPAFLRVPQMEESNKTYQRKGYLQPNRIKNISIANNKVKVTYLPADILYEIGFHYKTGVQFTQNKNLPKTQATYAQGIPLNGTNTHFGPDEDIPFSYGPQLSSLEFDGSNFPFDTHGRLVKSGKGNGQMAIAYPSNLYKNSFKIAHTAFFNISNDTHFYGFEYTNKREKDAYAQESNSLHSFRLNYNNSENYDIIEWQAEMKYITAKDNQPNINGFKNNLLLNALVTPVSFSNTQGSSLANGTPRSFSPTKFNNPNWLLNHNRNKLLNDSFISILRNKYHISDEVRLQSKLSYTQHKNEQQFGFSKNTVGYSNGYSSDKLQTKTTFDANISINWHTYNPDFDLTSTFFYTNENLNYSFAESSGFLSNAFQNPQKTTTRKHHLNRDTFRWFSKLDFEFIDAKAKVSFVNNSFVSSLQNSKWFLPTLQAQYQFANAWYSNFLKKLNLSTTFGYDVSYLNLYYTNQSHYSIQLAPQDSFGYVSNADLFVSDAVNLEEKRSYELSLDVGFEVFNTYCNLNTTYYNNVTSGSVFPVFESNQFQLQNIADIQNEGVEFTLDIDTYGNHDFRYTPSIVFSTYNTKVLQLHTSVNSIPIAGFSSVSKNLIKGETAGVLVGSAYERDGNNNIIIDSDGFPKVSSSKKIIGDPTPDFNLGFSNTLKWKNLQLDFVIDYQKGGDIWNGTQQVLNYFGTSEQSALERETTGFVFNGVNEQGEINRIPVDFANPANGLSGNRFTKYGFDGIAEEAIVNGSYVNLKSIHFFYDIKSTTNTPFFREVKIGLYGNNLLTFSKYSGASPYQNLFSQASTQGLNFFNTPILSEVGMTINIKI